jgi:hypothetical protein
MLKSTVVLEDSRSFYYFARYLMRLEAANLDLDWAN